MAAFQWGDWLIVYYSQILQPNADLFDPTTGKTLYNIMFTSACAYTSFKSTRIQIYVVVSTCFLHDTF